ncbi:hypothetical protein [Pseudarthrobacter sp. C4D7]|nr:hypothetical protein [Pseudarthrobacter sp. C4D7]
MHQGTIEWRIIGEERFNRVVEALLMRMFHQPPASRVEVIDGRGGDGGIDVAVYVDDKVDRIFQLKHFPEGFSGGFRENRRPQIKKSFETAWKNHQPPRWALVFPGNPTVNESKFVTVLGQNKKVTATVWGQARLDSEMAKFPDLLAWATRDSLVETLKTFHQEKAALEGPNDLEDRARALHQLVDGRSAYWGVDFGVTEHGVTKIIRAKNPRAAELEPLGFRFNVSTNDEALSRSIKGVLDYGARRKVAIPGAAVSDFSTIGPDWFQEAGDVQLVELPAEECVPADRPIPLSLEFLDSAGFTSARHQGFLTRKSSGLKGIGFTARFCRVLELDAEIPFDTSEPGNFSISLDLANASVSDAKNALRIIEEFNEGASIQILWDGKKLLKAATNEQILGLADPASELLIDDLSVLEKRLNAAFVVPVAVTNRERVMIRIARLLTEGHATWLPPEISLTAEISDDFPDELAHHLAEHRAVLMQIPALPIEIQGSMFNMGPALLHHPDAVVQDHEVVLKAIADGTAAGMTVKFDPADEQLIRVIPMPENGITPKVVDWGLPDIPVPGLEQQSREDVELFEEPDSEM